MDDTHVHAWMDVAMSTPCAFCLRLNPPPPCGPVLSDEVPLVVSRQIVMAFAQEISKMPAEVYKPVAVQ